MPTLERRYRERGVARCIHRNNIFLLHATLFPSRPSTIIAMAEVAEVAEFATWNVDPSDFSTVVGVLGVFYSLFALVSFFVKERLFISESRKPPPDDICADASLTIHSHLSPRRSCSFTARRQFHTTFCLRERR